jgi:hypothetical protein
MGFFRFEAKNYISETGAPYVLHDTHFTKENLSNKFSFINFQRNLKFRKEVQK